MQAEHLMGAAGSLNVALLLLTGVAVSLGHCLGMCGPLVGALAGAQRSSGLSVGAVARAHLVYHSGRIVCYAMLGLVVASLGSVLGLGFSGKGAQGVLSIAAGVLMIILGLGLLGWLPTQRLLTSRRLTGAVLRVSTLVRQRRGSGTWLLLGAANGLLPCGPVYAMAAGAAASPPLEGALAMLLFGLGTAPALLAFALGAARLSPGLQRRFNRLAAILVLLIGLQLVLRGAAALGWIAHLRFGSFVLY
jgi:sulfite exporter TauE/SafE